MSREFPKNNPPEKTSPKIALPTVGRIVHVFNIVEHGYQTTSARAAIVAGLCAGDGYFGAELRINLGFWASDGSVAVGGLKNVKHASLPRGFGEPYWDWMDFQKGQAAKTEALEAQLKEQAANPLVSVPDTPLGNEMGKGQAGAPSPVDGKR